MRTLTISLTTCVLAALPAVATAQDPTTPTTPTTPVEQPPAPTAPVTGRVIAGYSWDGRLQPRRSGLPAAWFGFQSRPLGRAQCFQLRCARHNLRLVTSPVKDGARAARFEVRDRDNPFGTDERAEAQGAPTGPLNSNRWYTWSVYLPPNFSAAGANASRYMFITKWAIARGSAPLSLAIDRGHLSLRVIEQSRPGRIVGAYTPWGVPVTQIRGRWVDFAMFVRWRGDGTGQIQLYVDGVQQPMNWPLGNDDGNPAQHGGKDALVFTGRTGVPRGGSTFIKQGIARSTAIRGRTVVLFDAMNVRAATAIPTPTPPAPAPDPAAPPA